MKKTEGRFIICWRESGNNNGKIAIFFYYPKKTSIILPGRRKNGKNNTSRRSLLPANSKQAHKLKKAYLISFVEAPGELTMKGLQEAVFAQADQVDREIFLFYRQRHIFPNDLPAGIQRADNAFRAAFHFK